MTYFLKVFLSLLPSILTFQSFPKEYYPAKASSVPRLWIKQDISRLKAIYNDTNNQATTIFKKEITKLMSYPTACGDWRCESGWPAAALALAWIITGDVKYGSKALSTYIPYFEGKPKTVGRMQSITHYALAYDWLRGHPEFTEIARLSLAEKLVSWSDAQYTSDTTKVSYIAQDSDHLTAVTTSHFIAGCALYGDHEKASELMDRGWTGVKEGYNNNTLIPYVSIEDMFSKTKNGHPLPGWDYYWMSDGWDLQNLWYVLDELGYVSPYVKNWWPKAIVNFIHNIDPANTHYRWLGDTQSGVMLNTYSGYIWSGISNAIYMAEKYGFNNEAACGRYFLDHLTRPSYGIGEGDPMQFMARSYDSSASRIDYTTTLNSIPRYVIYDGIGQDQRMGYGYFRSGWTSNSTWGGFAGIGNYLVDHMHAIHGSFFLWRNSEYLCTDPHNYGGETAAEIYSSLSIPNPKQYDQGGPLFYSNQFPAYLERGRVIVNNSSDLFYAVLNANGSYNQPNNKWETSQPVKSYKRHFMYDGQDYVFILDRAFLKTNNYTSFRIRNQNKSKPPESLANDLVSLPSDKGGYRLLLKIFEPANLKWSFTNEETAFNGKVDNWLIDKTMYGYLSKATSEQKQAHLWLSVLHIGEASASNSVFDNAAKITSDNKLIGVFAGFTVFIASSEEQYIYEAVYTTPAQTVKNARHVIADLNPGCYSIKGSNDGNLGKLNVLDKDNTLIFNAISEGKQNFNITTTTDCSNTNSIPDKNSGYSYHLSFGMLFAILLFCF